MSDDDLEPDDAEPDDAEPDDLEPDDAEPEPASTVSLPKPGPVSGLNALNSFFGSDYFKGINAFDELFKPGGAWNAMMGNATKGLVTPELLEMFDRQVAGMAPNIIGQQMAQKLLDQIGPCRSRPSPRILLPARHSTTPTTGCLPQSVALHTPRR